MNEHIFSERDIARFWSHVDCTGDRCWEWKLSTKGFGGYGTFQIQKPKPHGVPPHRVAYIITYGAIPSGLWVLHRCDNRPCVRPDHLFLGTNLDNIADRVAKGRSASGDRNGSRIAKGAYQQGEKSTNAKLTSTQVIDIRQRVANIQKPHRYNTYAQLAQEYGVSFVNICKIVHRKTWRHI